MARYIDAEALTDRMLERYNDLCEEHGDYDHYTTGYGDAIDVIENAPTADVVPNSEVERLEHILDSYALQYGTVTEQQEIIDEAKAEVAREIFEEISKASADWGCYCISAFKWGYVTTDVSKTLAELKKKYTESEG